MDQPTLLAGLAPILVTSPIQRSGTTLLQRLLSSSPDTLIFGETCANDLNLLTSLLMQKRSMYGRKEKWRSDQLAGVLRGDVNDWIPDLMPDTETYLEQFEQAVGGFLQYFAGSAAMHGRENWGVKLPGWNVFQLEQILLLMPGSRVIYLVRDIEDCVRSAKLMQLCERIEDTRQFIRIWQYNLQEARKRLVGPQVLWMDYEELTTQPDKEISRLGQFAGCSNMDRDVMNHRINNYHRSHNEPPALSSEERQLIRELQAIR
jgi:hypothetical protein